MKKVIDEIIGWYGAFAILIAYALLSFDYISGSNTLYQILNGTGAIGIVYISLKKKAYPPAVLNMVWFIIACVALLIR